MIDQLARDLHQAFPEMQGFPSRNLKYMRALAEAWPDEAIVQEPLAQLTGYHNLTLLEKVKSRQERLWYARQAIQHGWSRNVLVIHIESDLYSRQGRSSTNFKRRQTAKELAIRIFRGRGRFARVPQSAKAAFRGAKQPRNSRSASSADGAVLREYLKDPYTFDFLALTAGARERDLELGLLAHLRNLLIELGVGFVFAGSQVPLEVGGEDFKIDLLFYHLKPRCFVVIDLK